MVGISDIRDRGSLEAWLRDQPRTVAVSIASRAAARVLPVCWKTMLPTEFTHGANVTEWGHRSNAHDTLSLRCLLISDVAGRRSTLGLQAAAAKIKEHGIIGKPFSAASSADGAARAAASAVAAEQSARPAALAAFSAARAADTVHGATDLWASIRADAQRVANGGIAADLPLWPEGTGPLAAQWRALSRRVADSKGAEDWQFWIEWYDSLLAGRPMLGEAARTWEMLEKIALIDPETWDRGPEAVNPVIREIWEGYRDGGEDAKRASGQEPISDDARSTMKQRVSVNRDALAVASAGLMDQLDAFRENVRGMNHLQPEVRAEVLEFIDDIADKLSGLLQDLPKPGESMDDARADRLVLWLREYRELVRRKLAHYGSAENMAEATVPTGIILGATGIGAMLGMPVAGAVVGGLIVNQMKPGQAAKELTKSQGNDGEPG
jgi:hypothetical protein